MQWAAQTADVVRTVEILSVPILALFVLSQPARERPRMLRHALLIGSAAVLGEEMCIRLYGMYAYSPFWRITPGVVPLMVGCIWPAVVLSARGVVSALWGRPVALAVGAMVLLDATLVEAVSVHCGLWRWTEGAAFGVPFIGLWGWAAFAFAASLMLDRNGPALVRGAVAVVMTHALLLVAWWGALRWMLRAPLEPVALAAASTVVCVGLCGVLRSRRGSVPLALMAPRAVAALLFFGLLATHAATAAGLVAFAAPFALPYLWITRWRQPRTATAGVPV